MVMDALTDRQLLNEFIADRSDTAFAELVKRYLDMVYASALRQVRDPAMAEDISQAVFILLARKASRVRPEVLPAWLLSVARFAARDAIKTQAIRQRLEREAAAMRSMQPADDWDAVAARLDEAMSALSSADRAAVALRCLAGRKMAEVAERLAISEAAAKKRVARALIRLRNILADRGVRSPEQLLNSDWPASVVPCAPAALFSAVAGGAMPTPIPVKLAHAANRSLMRSRAKLAGSIAGAVIVPIVVAGSVLVWSKHPPTVSIASPVPSTNLSPVAPVPSAAAPEPATEPGDLVGQVLQGLSASEKKLSNLKIESVTKWEKWDPAAKVWKYSGETGLTAWYEAKPLGKARIDYHPEVIEWIGGTGPFSWDVYQRAYDGKETRQLDLEGGHAGQAF